jgi:hypothetical protein
MNEASTATIASNKGARFCVGCGIESNLSARFCWNCGEEATGPLNFTSDPLKVVPGEPMYITPNSLNICSPGALEVSYIEVDSMQATAPVPKTNTSEKLTLHSLIPRTVVPGSMDHDGAMVDVSDGASTTVSDNDNSSNGNTSRSMESVDTTPVQEVTTLMVCPLPYEVCSEELLEAVNKLGFSGAYDFVYMPSRSTRKGAKSRKGNVGYAFVNFGTAELATQFAAAFEGYCFPDVEDKRLIAVKAAACQGYTANFAMYLANKKRKQGDFMTFPMAENV